MWIWDGAQQKHSCKHSLEQVPAFTSSHFTKKCFACVLRRYFNPARARFPPYLDAKGGSVPHSCSQLGTMKRCPLVSLSEAKQRQRAMLK